MHRFDLLEDEHFDHHLHIAMFCVDHDGSREGRSEACDLIIACFYVIRCYVKLYDAILHHLVKY